MPLRFLEILFSSKENPSSVHLKFLEALSSIRQHLGFDPRQQSPSWGLSIHSCLIICSLEKPAGTWNMLSANLLSHLHKFMRYVFYLVYYYSQQGCQTFHSYLTGVAFSPGSNSVFITLLPTSFSLLKALLASALQLVLKSMPRVFRFFITIAPYFQIPISLSFLLLSKFFLKPQT